MCLMTSHLAVGVIYQLFHFFLFFFAFIRFVFFLPILFGVSFFLDCLCMCTFFFVFFFCKNPCEIFFFLFFFGGEVNLKVIARS